MRFELAVAAAEGQDGELGIERPGGPNGVVVAADPVDRSVAQQQPAVLAHGRLFTQPEQKSCAAPSRPLALVNCLDDFLFDLPREAFFAVVTVNRGGRGGVVGVGGVDQDMVEGIPVACSIRRAARSSTSRLTIRTSQATSATLPPCGSSITTALARSSPS